jgi:hypothetical protein
MGEERMDELGVTRRSFLKRVGAAAFVAPVVVSFGMDGIAEAHSSFPNQTFGNQVQNNNNQGQNNNRQGQNEQ